MRKLNHMTHDEAVSDEGEGVIYLMIFPRSLFYLVRISIE